jgi:ribose 5-phosphate isomerase A
MRIGIGSGSTMKYVIDRLSSLAEEKKWNITCVPASISTREALRKKKNLIVRSLLEISNVHLVIDGTNELDIVLNQIKGRFVDI